MVITATHVTLVFNVTRGQASARTRRIRRGVARVSTHGCRGADSNGDVVEPGHPNLVAFAGVADEVETSVVCEFGLAHRPHGKLR